MATETVEALALQAFELSRREVLVHLRFLNGASNLLRPLAVRGGSLATDGTHIRFDPVALVRSYAQDPGSVAHAYLHVLLHNVFLHPYAGEGVDQRCWDAACDIAVEKAIAQLNLGGSVTQDADQAHILASRSELLSATTAEALYRALKDAALTTDELDEIRAPFLVDDHSPWHRVVVEEGERGASADGSVSEGDARSGEAAVGSGESGTDIDIPEEAADKEKSHASHRGMAPEDIQQKETPENAAIAEGERLADTINLDRSREQWENAALEMGVQMDSYLKLWGTEGSNLSMNLDMVTRKRRSYREFLRKFTTQGEHIRVNDDEFDYVFYCYGLNRYGNLPLIEPLEYVEERRIRDFAIAIDTSASTKDGLVRRFLETTASVLGNEDSFFADFNVFIIQCDAAITDVARIRNGRDLDDYLDRLEIKGLGGTDFRPVFSYVDGLVATGEAPDLAGLLYLTDGFGTYPSKAPDYQTAFVFVDEESAAAATVPGWAMKAVLEDEQPFGFRRRPPK